jgi:hypothetical protein
MKPEIFPVFVGGGSYTTTFVLLSFAFHDMARSTWISAWANNETSTRLVWEDA